MPRSKKDILQLPASVKEDAKTISTIVNRWAGNGEEVINEAIGWGKKHKFLLAVSIALIAIFKYLFDEQKKEEDY